MQEYPEVRGLFFDRHWDGPELFLFVLKLEIKNDACLSVASQLAPVEQGYMLPT